MHLEHNTKPRPPYIWQNVIVRNGTHRFHTLTYWKAPCVNCGRTVERTGRYFAQWRDQIKPLCEACHAD